MLGSFYSGISGLNVNSLAINVVGNNISNVNTVGFKGSRASFEDALYQYAYGTSGSSQIGRGANLSSVDTMFSQGSFESTTSATDLAIGGKGFFIVRSPNNEGNLYYTRAGQFSFDKNGFMTNPAGDVLQGWQMDNTANPPVQIGSTKDVQITQQGSPARATNLLNMVLNLKSDSDWKAAVDSLPSGAVTSISASDGAYPSVGTYTATSALRTADHTGTNAAGAGPFVGTLMVNGTSIALNATNAADLDALVATINGQSATTGVAATNAGGRLQLTGTAPGKDITVSTAGIISGDIGWTATDTASTDLYGAELSLAGPDGLNTGNINIKVAGGNLANFGDSGIDLTVGPVTAGTQTITVRGLQDATDPATAANYSSSMTVYDSLGQSHGVTVYFREASPGNWEWRAWDPAGRQTLGLGTLAFDANGVLQSPLDPQTINLNGQPMSLSFGYNGSFTTQTAAPSSTNQQTQDGYPPGTLTNVTVSPDGTIEGHYDNGQNLALYRIALANFNNPGGLSREGGNLFAETLDSGVPLVGAPGTNGTGTISPNSLEQSNVDLATEFVKMIVAQRGFQANSKVITTSDEMLQELMNIKR